MNNFKQELKGMFTEYWKYMAVYSACKQDLFDLILSGNNTVISLSEVGGFNKNVLSDLLIVLEQQSFLRLNNSKIELTSKGKLLTEYNQESLKYACLNWGGEHLNAWQNLDYTLKTGKPSFEKIYNKSFFDYIADDNTKTINYHKAMNEYARDDYQNICDVHDFSIHKSIMDVGGSLGALIETISNNNPNTDCYLFDRPEVIELNTSSNYKKLKGDFLVTVPKVSDAIIMSRVIHDWDDNNAKTILNNVYDSLPEMGTLYLVENLTNEIDDGAAILSLNMHTITNSNERSFLEYKGLLTSSGFKVGEQKRINDFQYLIISKK